MSLSVQTLHSLHGFFWVKSLNVTPTPQTEGFSKDFQGFFFFCLENDIFNAFLFRCQQQSSENLVESISSHELFKILCGPAASHIPSVSFCPKHCTIIPGAVHDTDLLPLYMWPWSLLRDWKTSLDPCWTPFSFSLNNANLDSPGAYGRSSLWSSVCYQHLHSAWMCF